MDERPLPFPRPGERLAAGLGRPNRLAPADGADELSASLALARLTPKQLGRLERARRWEARLNAHPWLYAVPAGAAPVFGALVVNAIDGVSLTRGITGGGAPVFVGAAVALLLARYDGPRAARRRVIRLVRRYRRAGIEPGA